MANNWSPQLLLSVKIKDSNFTVRWVSQDKYEARIAEGWRPVTYKEIANLAEATLEDGKSLDSVVKRRELVLCKLPKAMAEERKKYYEQKAKDMAISERNQYLKESGGYISKEDNIVDGGKK